MHVPDYSGKNLANLVTSVGSSFGINPQGVLPLEVLGGDFLEESAGVVLVVLDGLGYNFLASRGKASVLARNLHSKLETVFPSTTAAAVTTIYSGLTPQSHGVLGWHLFLKEMGVTAKILPMVTRGGDRPLLCGNITARDIFGFEPLFERVARARAGTGEVRLFSVLPSSLVDTPYNEFVSGPASRVGYDALPAMFEKIEGCLRQPTPVSDDAGGDKPLVVAYWPDLDDKAHEHGVDSAETVRAFWEVDDLLGQFVDRLGAEHPGTRVLVTADHGLVNCTGEGCIRLRDHPVLERCLALPLCGESRAPFCYVRPSRVRQFEEYVRGNLSEACELRGGRELVEAGYLGAGTPHPRLLDRMGDYVLLMEDGYVLRDRLLGEEWRDMVGYHGGLSEDEAFVPLVVF
ncbi:MAG: alkaline phosphatase family protein [Promethearchaeota archaeon]